PAARGADALVREISDSDVVGVRRVLERRIQGVGGNPVESRVCMYTMTPDEHFIVDRHPGCERVVFACGFSGHGFKFAPLIGDVLADFVIGGRTSAPIDFLRAARFA
ncbi:MAG: FAD-dependent oxidoreductase, partial [Planctomycetota bacterium]